MITSSLSWADRGFPVFPIVPRGKKPLGSLVPHGLKEAAATEPSLGIGGGGSRTPT